MNCVLEFSKVVALPDYCASESGLMVTVADSADREYEETEFGVRLYVSVCVCVCVCVCMHARMQCVSVVCMLMC